MRPFLPWRRRLRTGGLAAVLAVSALAGLMPSAGRAEYVYYYRVFGDWAVICSLDEPTDSRSCTLSGPPPALAASKTVVAIKEPAADQFEVAVRVLAVIAPGQPLHFTIDASPPHQASPDRFGAADWTGAEAAAIVGELDRGHRLEILSFLLERTRQQQEVLSLEGFSEALAAFRRRLRDQGILKVP